MVGSVRLAWKCWYDYQCKTWLDYLLREDSVVVVRMHCCYLLIQNNASQEDNLLSQLDSESMFYSLTTVHIVERQHLRAIATEQKRETTLTCTTYECRCSERFALTGTSSDGAL